ncbi:hypothetical protein V9T40_007903 [Parthenolecanium corni]|uniref:Uncharacterized protein n=1 Tax=Parthenolecanium corni TaxID=536013 RepID=A0AAN9Y8H8_9HEMI
MAARIAATPIFAFQLPTDHAQSVAYISLHDATRHDTNRTRCVAGTRARAASRARGGPSAIAPAPALAPPADRADGAVVAVFYFPRRRRPSSSQVTFGRFYNSRTGRPSLPPPRRPPDHPPASRSSWSNGGAPVARSALPTARCAPLSTARTTRRSKEMYAALLLARIQYVTDCSRQRAAAPLAISWLGFAAGKRQAAPHRNATSIDTTRRDATRCFLLRGSGCVLKMRILVKCARATRPLLLAIAIKANWKRSSSDYRKSEEEVKNRSTRLSTLDVHWALGIGHWALDIGHWALGIGHGRVVWLVSVTMTDAFVHQPFRFSLLVTRFNVARSYRF